MLLCTGLSSVSSRERHTQETRSIITHYKVVLLTVTVAMYVVKATYITTYMRSINIYSARQFTLGAAEDKQSSVVYRVDGRTLS